MRQMSNFSQTHASQTHASKTPKTLSQLSQLSQLSRILRILDIQKVSTLLQQQPETAERLCWHCCHPWDGTIIKLPIKHDKRLGKFKVVGQFCSWQCLKGYNRDYVTNIRNSINDVNIRYYRKELTGNTVPVVSAPPRSFLKAFGGTMTIDEFRKTSCSFSESSMWSDVLIPINTSRFSKSTPANQKTSVDENRQVDFGDAVSKNDSFRLRRPKPLAHGGRNGLERALGLNSLIKIK